VTFHPIVRLHDLFRRKGRVSSVDLLRTKFERFRRLVDRNSRVLELMADAGAKLGGDYLFDAQYLRWLDAELAEAVRAVVEDLAEVSGDRYPALQGAFERIRAAVRASLESRGEARAGPVVIPLDTVGTELAALVGEKMARLGEVRSRLGLKVPGGFVITAAACQRLLAQPFVAGRLEILRRGQASLAAASARLAQAIREAEVPPDVAAAVKRALSGFEQGPSFAVRSSALGEDGELSFAGQHLTLLNVPRDRVLDAWLQVVASLFSPRAMEYRRRLGLPVPDAEMAVGCILMVPAVASGVVYTVDPADPERSTALITATRGLGVPVVEGRGGTDRFTLSRISPHRVLSRAVTSKPEMCVAARDGGVVMVPVPIGEQDAPAVTEEALAEVVRASLRIERHMRCPQDVEWAVAPDEGVMVLQARPLRVSLPARRKGEELVRALERYPVLLRGRGVVACRGVGAGRVFVVGAAETVRDVPPGGVLVARHSSPRLSALASSASAIVTDVGAATGHLATIAREYRIPTILDTGGATQILRPGMEATVDAEENIIYEGIVEELLSYELLQGDVYDETPEFRVLRRMLGCIAPLHLKDPEDPGFTPDRCRTYHDIIRFAHEQALAALADLDKFSVRSREDQVHKLDVDIPLDLLLVDIGDGLAPDVRGPVRLDAVESRPLRLLMEGLTTPGVWTTRPAHMDLEGFMSSATRLAPLSLPGAATVERNVAIISREYLNLNLRVGYHFTVVDCYLGEGPEDSYLFFRFVGGVTDLSRRTRRARLLSEILERHDFVTNQNGDLVVGRLKGVPRPVVEERVQMVGRLIGFSRQLDIFLKDEEIVDRLVSDFMHSRYEAAFGDATEENTMGGNVEVMVLDDEATVGERLKDFLEKRGMAVETFRDSGKAIHRLQEKRFDVIVTDLKMPGPNGVDVLLSVKERSPSTQVILITGYATIEAAREAEAIGAFDFILKPFELEDLHKLVKKAAKRSSRLSKRGGQAEER
jgi:pyruvate,water dikinase